MYISSFQVENNFNPKYFYLETSQKFEECFNETVNNTSKNSLNILVHCLKNDRNSIANQYIKNKIISTSLNQVKK